MSKGKKFAGAASLVMLAILQGCGGGGGDAGSSPGAGNGNGTGPGTPVSKQLDPIFTAGTKSATGTIGPLTTTISANSDWAPSMVTTSPGSKGEVSVVTSTSSGTIVSSDFSIRSMFDTSVHVSLRQPTCEKAPGKWTCVTGVNTTEGLALNMPFMAEVTNVTKDSDGYSTTMATRLQVNPPDAVISNDLAIFAKSQRRRGLAYVNGEPTWRVAQLLQQDGSIWTVATWESADKPYGEVAWFSGGISSLTNGALSNNGIGEGQGNATHVDLGSNKVSFSANNAVVINKPDYPLRGNIKVSTGDPLITYALDPVQTIKDGSTKGLVGSYLGSFNFAAGTHAATIAGNKFVAFTVTPSPDGVSRIVGYLTQEWPALATDGTPIRPATVLCDFSGKLYSTSNDYSDIVMRYAGDFCPLDISVDQNGVVMYDDSQDKYVVPLLDSKRPIGSIFQVTKVN